MIAEDPLRDLPVGSELPIVPVVFGGSDATVVPDGVNNWTFFDGALMGIVTRDKHETTVMGTGAMIAPGLAVTATHVLRDRLEEVLAGDVALLCVAPTNEAVDFWNIRAINKDEVGDIAYLSLELASAISPVWRLRTFPLTTRAPRPGESVHIVGFRLEATHEPPAFAGELLGAAGEVTAVYHPIRDRVLMPYPAIEIACGSLGGMSGGAVLDDQGFLLGIISRGMTIEDGRGPTYAAWLVGGLDRQLTIPWPPGLHPEHVHLLDIDPEVLRIEGRDRFTVLDGGKVAYEVWSDR
jgi:hypothetical protein